MQHRNRSETVRWHEIFSDGRFGSLLPPASFLRYFIKSAMKSISIRWENFPIPFKLGARSGLAPNGPTIGPSASDLNKKKMVTNYLRGLKLDIREIFYCKLIGRPYPEYIVCFKIRKYVSNTEERVSDWIFLFSIASWANDAAMKSALTCSTHKYINL